MKKKVSMLLILSMILCGVSGNKVVAEGKKKTPKLNKKVVEIAVGKRSKVTIKNVNPKKVKWTIKTGKKNIRLINKKKKSAVIVGKKKGNATVEAKVTYKGKTTKLKVKVTVKKKSDNATVTVSNKKQTAFPGKVTFTFTEDGYVRVKWTKVEDAHAYVVQRKKASGSWINKKVTSSTSYTDFTVASHSTYSYRVRANCDGMCTKYSEPITVETGEIIGSDEDESSAAATPTPTMQPEPTPTATPEPTPTPYQAKYSYEVEVLNKFEIYENVPIVLYVKTDNPNPNDFDNVYVSLSGGSEMCGYDYQYEDIRYIEQEETNSTFFNKVNGGWIVTIQFSSPGEKNVKIQELEKGKDNNNKWQTVDTFQIKVKEGTKVVQEYCNKVIAEVSDENYNDDERGNWNDLTTQEKMERLEDYVRGHYHYPRHGALTSLGYMPVWYIQENVGAYWETGFADCGASNELLCQLARTIGLTATRQNTTLNGSLHIVANVTIDGAEYIYDATPWQGGYGDWDYIL